MADQPNNTPPPEDTGGENKAIELLVGMLHGIEALVAKKNAAETGQGTEGDVFAGTPRFMDQLVEKLKQVGLNLEGLFKPGTAPGEPGKEGATEATPTPLPPGGANLPVPTDLGQLLKSLMVFLGIGGGGGSFLPTLFNPGGNQPPATQGGTQPAEQKTDNFWQQLFTLLRQMLQQFQAPVPSPTQPKQPPVPIHRTPRTRSPMRRLALGAKRRLKQATHFLDLANNPHALHRRGGQVGGVRGRGMQAMARMMHSFSQPNTGTGNDLGGIAGVLGGVGRFASMGGTIGMTVAGIAALGVAAVKSIEGIQQWSENLHQANMRFSEYSAAMAQVRAEQEVRDIFLSKERGDRRAGPARELAETKSRLAKLTAPWGDAFANSQAHLDNLAGQAIEKILGPLNEIARSVGLLEKGGEDTSGALGAALYLASQGKAPFFKGKMPAPPPPEPGRGFVEDAVGAGVHEVEKFFKGR